jgi:6-pyruvoyltetrahydropterin/6-carboxytetrahydropterin synthase
MELSVDFHFSASHALPGLSADAGRLHGHNYILTVVVAGPVDPETGVVVDFDGLDQAVREEILERVDHRHLNTLLVTPTAEVMLAWFWSLLAPRTPLLSALHLQETPRYRATYRGEGDVVVRLAESET